MKNAIVGQSGGPTAAINATLSGVIRGCLNSNKINTLFGMFNGIEGLFNENLCDLTKMFKDEKNLLTLEKTPAAALGSCRRKLPSCDDETKICDYEKLFTILGKLNIGYFFYIGGNDSMDTIGKMSAYADKIGSDIKFLGVPKTIDNDLMCTDHTPGYGSAAKFVSTVISEIICDTSVYTVKAVTFVEIMGRDAGWLTLSAALPRLYKKPAPDLVYLPEADFDIDNFIEDIKKAQLIKPNLVVALSEGIRDKNGNYIADSKSGVKLDAFGHKALGGAGKVLESLVKEKIGCKARTVELSLLQRCAAHLASKTDIDESVMIGKYAVETALNGDSGYMVGFERSSESEYYITPIKVPVSEVANAVRQVPDDFINAEKNNITDKGLEWIAPLVIGESIPDFENGLPIQCIIKK